MKKDDWTGRHNAVAVLIKEKKKWAWLLMLIPVLVGISRIIRCVHYPSDVLGGMVFGIASGLIGYYAAWRFFLRDKKQADQLNK